VLFLCVEEKEDGPEKKGVTRQVLLLVWTVGCRVARRVGVPRPRAGRGAAHI
jgi:hypothetical protein